MNVKKAGIILKRGSDAPKRICRELVEWFSARSIETVIDTIPSDLDILVILGGDGTLLHVAEKASRLEIPVVGVNLGGLGFLTEVVVDECFEVLETILAGPVAIENRMMIKAKLFSGKETSEWFYALNDVVISKGTVDRLVRLSVWADKEYITTYRADGIVFSTPTGSTAYNLSAGGPIVVPSLSSILVTPICPFMLESRPVLLPPHVDLTTTMAGSVEDVKVIVDGRSVWDMKENDLLEVQAAKKPLRLICSPQKGYFEILRNKLNWGGRTTSLPSGRPQED